MSAWAARISAAVRHEARLLITPEETREGRTRLALTVAQFANLLGVPERTVARWESGAQIQQLALDQFLRLCVATPAAVEVLSFDAQPITNAATK